MKYVSFDRLAAPSKDSVAGADFRLAVIGAVPPANRMSGLGSARLRATLSPRHMPLAVSEPARLSASVSGAADPREGFRFLPISTNFPQTFGSVRLNTIRLARTEDVPFMLPIEMSGEYQERPFERVPLNGALT